MKRLAHHEEIYNTFIQAGLKLYYSQPVLRHLVHFVDSILTKGFSGTLTDVHVLSRHDRHRTTLSHFLTNGVWDEKQLMRVSQEQAWQSVTEATHQTKEPLMAIIDDSVCQKTKPSSQAQSGIQACDFHYSHMEGKSVWGHSFVSLMLRCGNVALPYTWEQYEKGSDRSKQDIAVDFVKHLPSWEGKKYVLVDTWFPSKGLIHACFQQGFHLIGGLKSNRILYPAGIRVQAKEFAKHIDVSETHLVTVGEETYHVYRYEGALNEIDYGVVLFCWNAKLPMEEQYPKYFLSTDTELSDEEILRYYAKRWAIETYFRQTKDDLSYDRYRVRNMKAIHRYWTIVQYAYVYCHAKGLCCFSEGLRTFRKQKEHRLIEFIYYETKSGQSLEAIKKLLQVA